MTNNTGLLVISNIKQLTQTLKTIQKYVVHILYIHLNVPIIGANTIASKSNKKNIIYSSIWSQIVSELYIESAKVFAESGNRSPNINILIGPLKRKKACRFASLNLKSIDVLYADSKHDPEVCEELRERLGITQPIVYLANDVNINQSIMEYQPINAGAENDRVFNDSVLGGTFDRIHFGHKIFLTHAVLKTCRRLVVGITSKHMLKSKVMSELIFPIEKRIADIKDFLEGIDSTLIYEIVQIDDPIGPTATDPFLEMIVVSAETMRGALRINEERERNNLNPLHIHCIDLVKHLDNTNDSNQILPKDLSKISSSNTRLELLGTRLRRPEPRLHLPNRPYIIGLTGGIGSGKSKIAEYFQSLGALVIDCDKVAHKTYEPSTICYQQIIKHFGNDILNDDLTINRQQLAIKVFKNVNELNVLNNIVWPHLLIEVKHRIQEDCGVHEVVILEAAVLFQAKWDMEVHEIWSMIIPVDEAVNRIMKRNNLTKEAALQRINSQIRNEALVANSHIVFSSQWDFSFTRKQAQKAWDILMEELKQK